MPPADVSSNFLLQVPSPASERCLWLLSSLWIARFSCKRRRGCVYSVPTFFLVFEKYLPSRDECAVHPLWFSFWKTSSVTWWMCCAVCSQHSDHPSHRRLTRDQAVSFRHTGSQLDGSTETAKCIFNWIFKNTWAGMGHALHVSLRTTGRRSEVGRSS